MGVIAFMLLAGHPPFYGARSEVARKIETCEPDWRCGGAGARWHSSVSWEGRDFVRRLLTKDPESRPDARAALRHWWLRRPEPLAAPGLGPEALRSLQLYARSSRIRRAILQLLAQELAPHEMRELREVFLRIDKESKGYISLQELREAICRCMALSGEDVGFDLPTPPDSPQAPGGSWGGVLHLLRPGSRREDAEDKVTPSTSAGSVLEEVEDDGSLAWPTQGAPERASRPDFWELCRALNSTGSDQVHYSDFLAATMEARPGQREEAVRRTFQRLDADGSGAIGACDVRVAIGETFEGACPEELISEVEMWLDGKREISYDSFVRLLSVEEPGPAPVREAERGTRCAPTRLVPSGRDTSTI